MTHISDFSKSDYKIAIVVNPALSIGFLANSIAAIAIGLGAAQPKLGDQVLTDQDGFEIKNSADRAIPILQADEEALKSLLLRANERPKSAQLVAFPAFARSLHSFDEYWSVFPTKSLRAEKIDGLGFCGPSKWIRSLTGSLKLLR
ncbi:MAG: DUF2000 family protein [Sneathiella sp.]